MLFIDVDLPTKVKYDQKKMEDRFEKMTVGTFKFKFKQVKNIFRKIFTESFLKIVKKRKEC